ncbi:MAG: FAD-dependent monooxygenase [Micropruina sp.]|uniref:FAD-dependent oxidoreductase n=1 Tax=Micropruina sp. TaxID=2737536 RepID=UPI0039E6E376
MTHRPLDIAVLGAGPTGLTAALLLARDGHRVTVCEADARRCQDGSATPRPGVSQFGLPHVLLPRWRHEMDAALPDLVPALLTAGARPVNLLHLQEPGTTGAARAGDDWFGTVAVGRAVLEQVLSNLAAGDPNVRFRFATRATGVLPSPRGERCLGGLRTEDDDVPADLVIDAGGGHSPVPGWLHDTYGIPPQQRRLGPRLTFFCRHFEDPGGPLPQAGPILTHHPSWSLLTLPTGHRRFAIVVAATADDRALRALRDPDAWHAAVESTVVGRAWAEHGRPVSGVLVHSAADAVPAEAGPAAVGRLVALGDAQTVTNPLLGRGVTIGALSAVTLRDSIRAADDVPEALARYQSGYAERVAGWVDSSLWLTRHRVAELRAQAAGEPYRADDARWAMTVALRVGALQDPVLARASTLVGGMLADAAAVFADPEVRNRCSRYLGAPATPSSPVGASQHGAVRPTPPTSPIGEEPSTTQGAHHVHLAR